MKRFHGFKWHVVEPEIWFWHIICTRVLIFFKFFKVGILRFSNKNFTRLWQSYSRHLVFKSLTFSKNMRTFCSLGRFSGRTVGISLDPKFSERTVSGRF